MAVREGSAWVAENDWASVSRVMYCRLASVRVDIMGGGVRGVDGGCVRGEGVRVACL